MWAAPSVNGSGHCGPIASGSGKTTLWQLFKTALQKMGTPSSHTPVLVLTSSDHKYPCACFCVDFNLVWQIISVSSSLFVTTTVALFLTFLLPCFWPSSTKLLLLQWPSFWPSYYNNISTVYIVHVWYYNKQSFKPSTKHLLLFFYSVWNTVCFIVVSTLHSVYAHQTYMRMYAVKGLHECYCLRLIPVQKQVTIFSYPRC